MRSLSICAMLVILAGCRQSIQPTPTPTGTPDAKITGEAQCKAGDLVYLSSQESKGVGTDWAIHPPSAKNRMHKMDDGIVFASSTPGEYTFYLAVGDNDDVSITSHTLHNGTSPTPPKPPTPPTPPNPPTPTDWLGKLENNTYILATSVVPAVGRYDQSQKMATALETVCSSIAAGVYDENDLPGARAAVRKATNEALGPAVEGWRTFAEELEKGLKHYNEQGKLVTLKDHQKAWGAIAKGLRKVPQQTATTLWGG